MARRAGSLPAVPLPVERLPCQEIRRPGRSACWKRDRLDPGLPVAFPLRNITCEEGTGYPGQCCPHWPVSGKPHFLASGLRTGFVRIGSASLIW